MKLWKKMAEQAVFCILCTTVCTEKWIKFTAIGPASADYNYSKPIISHPRAYKLGIIVSLCVKRGPVSVKSTYIVLVIVLSCRVYKFFFHNNKKFYLYVPDFKVKDEYWCLYCQIIAVMLYCNMSLWRGRFVSLLQIHKVCQLTLD